MSGRRDRLSEYSRTCPATQPDLSTCIMVMIIFASIVFIAGINWKIVAFVLGTAIPLALFIIYNAVQGESGILHDYQQRRILAWLHPEDYANSDAYQTLNSMMAIGSGQLYGKGYGKRTLVESYPPCS